jgi:hypothetical protein
MIIQAISSGTVFDSANSGQATSKKSVANSNAGTSGAQKSTASTSSASDFYYDVRDTNKDGVVSLVEEIEYALTHPGEAINSQAGGSTSRIQINTQYNQQGSLRVSTSDVPALIDISA